MNNEHPARKHRILPFLFAALGLWAVALTACSTIEGAGEDLEYVGEKLSETSRDAQD